MSDCENCIHKICKVSKYGNIYACERWICKPEYKEKKTIKYAQKNIDMFEIEKGIS